MTHIDYFKSMAKKLHKDLQTSYYDEEGLVQYSPRYFEDIDDIVLACDLNGTITLMNVQHIIAVYAGFKSWADLIHSSEARQEIGRLLLEHRDTINFEDWLMYEHDNCHEWTDESKLDLFKQVFLS